MESSESLYFTQLKIREANMSAYIEASNKGIAFCWCCTKTQMLAECGITRMSSWKMEVMKYRENILQETLDNMKNSMVQ